MFVKALKVYVYLQRVAKSPNLVLPEVETRDKTQVFTNSVKLYVLITFLKIKKI